MAQSKSMAGLLLGICVWNLIISIDSTALSTALPTISQELQANSTQAFWCGTSFVLCSAAFQPVIASFSDAFGRRSMTIVSLALFTIGAVICSLSHHVSVLILGRCVQGAGAGGLLTMTYVLMADNLDLHQRHKAISVISLTWLIGPVVGPIMSGGFTEKATWRWIFWLNLPFCALAFAILIFLVSSPYKAPHTGFQRLQGIDWIGSIVFVTSLTSFLLAISWGGTMFAWSSASTVVPLVFGIVGLISWVFYSVRLTSHPIIPIRVMQDRTAVISYIGNLVHGICFFGALYYVPVYYQAVKFYSPIISGVGMLPVCLVAGPFAAITGVLIAKTHLIKPYALVGWTVMAMSMGLLNLLRPDTKEYAWILLGVPVGVGLGVLYPALALATQAACEVSDKSLEEIEKTKSLAAGLNPFFRTVGQTLGIVISQAAFTNALSKRVGASAALSAESMLDALKALPAQSVERETAAQSVADSLRPVWLTLLALAVAMLLITLATKDVDLAAASASASSLSERSSISDAESCMKRPEPIVEQVAAEQQQQQPRRKFSLFGFTEMMSDGFHQGIFEGLHRASISDVPVVINDVRHGSTRAASETGRHGSVTVVCHPAARAQPTPDDADSHSLERNFKQQHNKSVTQVSTRHAQWTEEIEEEVVLTSHARP